MDREEKRMVFEQGIKYLKEKNLFNFPLAVLEVNGKFHKYMDSDTDSAWVGFQLACNYFKVGK